MVNGTMTPTLQLEAGKTYRLRLIQVHPQAVVLFRLGDDINTYRWTPVAKDGADLSPMQSVSRPSFVMMGAGETGDFLYTPERPGQEKMVISTRGAGWVIPLVIFVRPAAKLATR
jgi:FtsP/CotA-like multicopper oxidase with cupredoxin domain